MVTNDLIYENLIIGIVSRWSDDMFECARTLQYAKSQRYENVERIKVCTGVYVRRPDIETYVTKLCFSNLEIIAESLHAICDNPLQVLEKIWKECNSIYPYWSLYYNEHYNYLVGCLNGKH